MAVFFFVQTAPETKQLLEQFLACSTARVLRFDQLFELRQVIRAGSI